MDNGGIVTGGVRGSNIVIRYGMVEETLIEVETY